MKQFKVKYIKSLNLFEVHINKVQFMMTREELHNLMFEIECEFLDSDPKFVEYLEAQYTKN